MQSTVKTKAMSTKCKEKAKISPWLGNAMIIALGGMLFTCIMQWMMKICAVAWHGGYNIDPDAKMWCMLPLIMLGAYVWLTIQGGFSATPKKPPPRYSYDNSDSLSG